MLGQASEGELEGRRKSSQTIEWPTCFASLQTGVAGDRLAKITRQHKLLIMAWPCATTFLLPELVERHH